MSAIVLRNRQRVRRVNTPLLRRIVASLLDELTADGQPELCVHIVAAPEMARINQQFLQHEGSTDVITFDCSKYEKRDPIHSAKQKENSLHRGKHSRSRKQSPESRPLLGEIYICLDDAVAQAQEFHTTWQSELVRYLIHGILHLLGHDDLEPAARRKMKQQENRWLRFIAARFPLSRLERKTRLQA